MSKSAYYVVNTKYSTIISGGYGKEFTAKQARNALPPDRNITVKKLKTSSEGGEIVYKGAFGKEYYLD